MTVRSLRTKTVVGHSGLASENKDQCYQTINTWPRELGLSKGERHTKECDGGYWYVHKAFPVLFL